MEEIPHAYIQVGTNRYRESRGLYYEDFFPGDIFEHRPGRTVTQMDNMWFSLLTMNQAPMHTDVTYGSRTEFRRNLFNSACTLAIVGGMSVSTVSNKAICNLEFTEVKLPNPLFEGDTIYAETEVIDRRESRSRPTQGIVTVRTTGFNQDKQIVITLIRKVLVAKRGHGVADETEY